MTNLMKFENCNVEIIHDNNEGFLFELYSTGMALGQTKVVKGICYPRKERIKANILNAEITPVVRNGQQYLTESQLYDLMLEVKTEKVKPFRKWVVNEVLPSIRKTGSYSLEQKREQPYEYFDKTFNGVPVLSTLDIAHFTGLSQTTINWYIRKSDLICGIDYFVAEGRALAEMKKRYPKMSAMISRMLLITKSGFDKLMKENGVQVEPIPCFENTKCSEPVNNMHKLIDTVLVELNQLHDTVKKLDRYNTAAEQMVYKDKIQKLERSVSQKLVVISQVDMQEITGDFSVATIDKSKILESKQYSFLEEPLALFYNEKGNTTAVMLK